MPAYPRPPAPTGRPPRKRNPPGQGGRLRDEIIAATAALLERTGNEEFVTLRAVAREAGITYPAIAPHFADRAEIIDAVVAAELATLHATLAAALATSADPAEQLHAACRAYLAYGRASPNRYRVVFERRFLPLWEEQQRTMTETAPLMAETFEMIVDVLQACIDTGASTSTDAHADTVILWCALHGLVALPAAITSFPWPDTDTALANCVNRLARLTATRPAPARRCVSRAGRPSGLDR